jgi:hypothetical protein
MKTPKEEAERLSAKVYLEWFDHQGPCSHLPIFMANEIPLTELIAVARAAVTVTDCFGAVDVDWLRRQPSGNAVTEISCGDVVAIFDALQALRATGRVEL